jgi:hypothetical protein
MATKYRAMYEDKNTGKWESASKPGTYNMALEEVRRLELAGLNAMVESVQSSARLARCGL